MQQRQVRLPDQIHAQLIAETEHTGIGYPAVLARVILIERIHKGNLESLVAIAHSKAKEHRVSAKGPRITLRLSEYNEKAISEAVKSIALSFNQFVKAIMIERYGSLREKDDMSYLGQNWIGFGPPAQEHPGCCCDQTGSEEVDIGSSEREPN